MIRWEKAGRSDIDESRTEHGSLRAARVHRPPDERAKLPLPRQRRNAGLACNVVPRDLLGAYRKRFVAPVSQKS